MLYPSSIVAATRLRAYVKTQEITSPGWLLLTGSRAAIYTLARKSYIAEQEMGYTKDSTEFLHTEHFILVDKKQRIRGIYNGTLQLEMIHLIKDMHALLSEEQLKKALFSIEIIKLESNNTYELF